MDINEVGKNIYKLSLIGIGCGVGQALATVGVRNTTLSGHISAIISLLIVFRSPDLK